MTALMIGDLEACRELDCKARQAVLGGYGYLPNIETSIIVDIDQAVFNDISVLNGAKLGLGVDFGDGINIDVAPLLNVDVGIDLPDDMFAR